MQMIDFKKELKHLYSASAKASVIVEVPPLSFIMIDGIGDPNTSGAVPTGPGADRQEKRSARSRAAAF